MLTLFILLSILQHSLQIFPFIPFLHHHVRTHSVDVDATIEECIKKTEKFTKTEDKYADPDVNSLRGVARDGTPTVLGVPQFPLVLPAYYKEVRQRVFECISDKLHMYSDSELKSNKKYQKLVGKCKSQQEVIHCDLKNWQYRTINGTCNNWNYPKWGSCLSCLRRLTPAFYEGASGFGKSKCNKTLPCPRYMTLNYFKEEDRPNMEISNLIAVFAQLIAHDVIDTTMSSVKNLTMDCCAHKTKCLKHPQCAELRMKRDDTFYSKYHKEVCFNFIRNSACDTCSVGKRNQTTGSTSYLDLSFAYGSDDETAKSIRKYDGTGKLNAQYREEGELLPPDYFSGIGCGSGKPDEYCFKSGDRRTVQHTPLMAIQTVVLREHNRLCDELIKLNPEWDDEKLYQEARKINIGQFQIIIYNEFLRPLIGTNLMKKYNLEVLEERRTLYDPERDATTYNEFSTAAYRLHSIFSGDLLRDTGIDGGKKCLRDFYNRAGPIYHGDLGELMAGICAGPSQKYDRYIDEDLTNYLYRIPGLYGLDVAALDIHRGRDHGMPPYATFRRIISKGKINIRSFDDLYEFMDEDTVKKLKELYCNVDDIDLWVGLNSERVQEGMIAAPTTAEVIAIQFSDWMFGDRFHVQHASFSPSQKIPPVPQFSNEQLASLRTVTISSILCRNINIFKIQPNAMKIVDDDKNQRVPCSDIPKLDISLWKE